MARRGTLRTRLQAFSIGVVAGLVLLVKPVAFAMLIILWATALVLGIAIDWIRDRHFSRQIVRISFITLASCANYKSVFRRKVRGHH